MNKNLILSKLKKEEDKLFISKIIDKYNYAINKNKITSTNFVNQAEKELAKKIFNEQKIKNYLFYGVCSEYERCMIFFYPEKFDTSIVQSNYENYISIIRIKLPKANYCKYSHRDYLGGLIKLGISRDKIGDILVFEDGADIIVSSDIVNFLLTNLSSLIRFQKSEITKENLNSIRIMETKKEEIQIIIPSLRLDSIVSELAHTSRSKACSIIESENVFVNYICITKTNYLLKEQDTITIRRNGKYNIIDILGNTKKGNIILKLQKYC